MDLLRSCPQASLPAYPTPKQQALDAPGTFVDYSSTSMSQLTQSLTLSGSTSRGTTATRDAAGPSNAAAARASSPPLVGMPAGRARSATPAPKLTYKDGPKPRTQPIKPITGKPAGATLNKHRKLTGDKAAKGPKAAGGNGGGKGKSRDDLVGEVAILRHELAAKEAALAAANEELLRSQVELAATKARLESDLANANKRADAEAAYNSASKTARRDLNEQFEENRKLDATCRDLQARELKLQRKVDDLEARLEKAKFPVVDPDSALADATKARDSLSAKLAEVESSAAKSSEEAHRTIAELRRKLKDNDVVELRKELEAERKDNKRMRDERDSAKDDAKRQRLTKESYYDALKEAQKCLSRVVDGAKA